MKLVSIAERKQFRICKMQKRKNAKLQKSKNAKKAKRQKACIAIMKTHKTHLIAVGFCVFSVSHWLIAHRSKARIQSKRSGDGRKDTDYGLDNDFPGFFVFHRKSC